MASGWRGKYSAPGESMTGPCDHSQRSAVTDSRDSVKKCHLKMEGTAAEAAAAAAAALLPAAHNSIACHDVGEAVLWHLAHNRNPVIKIAPVTKFPFFSRAMKPTRINMLHYLPRHHRYYKRCSSHMQRNSSYGRCCQPPTTAATRRLFLSLSNAKVRRMAAVRPYARARGSAVHLYVSMGARHSVPLAQVRLSPFRQER